MSSILTPDIIDILLKERSFKRNLNFVETIEEFSGDDEITCDIVLQDPPIILPQYMYAYDRKRNSAKKRGAVFTPQFAANNMCEVLCRAILNVPDEENICAQIYPINETDTREWITDTLPPEDCLNLIYKTCLDSCCGEGIFLTQRYHQNSGKPIEIPFRKGLLDRKLHVIKRALEKEEDLHELRFFSLAKIAFKTTYGFDLLGKSVYLTRKNLLETFVDFYQWIFAKDPENAMVEDIATILSYNIFQMNGLSHKVPLTNQSVYARIRDWSKNLEFCFASIPNVNLNEKAPK